METAALIPVKAFGAAKARLRGHLGADDRRQLARWMAEQVVRAAAPAPAFVACDDDDVATWAEELGASVLWGPGLGLNGAVDHGVVTLRGKGFEHVVISHGDLPLAAGLAGLVERNTVVLVPDRRRHGTNVVARPTEIDLPAAYGPRSFGEHLRRALGVGARVRVRLDDRLAIDVDTPADLHHPEVRAVVDRAFPDLAAHLAG